MVCLCMSFGGTWCSVVRDLFKTVNLQHGGVWCLLDLDAMETGGARSAWHRGL
jgi:hypothetical protein